MDKGRKILMSLGGGLMVLAFLDFTMPVHISVGITVFVTILTFHDFMNAGSDLDLNSLPKEKKLIPRLSNGFLIVVVKSNSLIKALTEFFLFLSIPISVWAAFFAYQYLEIVDLYRFQQILTLYTLGLVISILSFSNTNSEQNSMN